MPPTKPVILTERHLSFQNRSCNSQNTWHLSSTRVLSFVFTVHGNVILKPKVDKGNKPLQPSPLDLKKLNTAFPRIVAVPRIIASLKKSTLFEENIF